MCKSSKVQSTSGIKPDDRLYDRRLRLILIQARRFDKLPLRLGIYLQTCNLMAYLQDQVDRQKLRCAFAGCASHGQRWEPLRVGLGCRSDAAFEISSGGPHVLPLSPYTSRQYYHSCSAQRQDHG